jgi:prepilin-type N-terminal cleavage/methylation domain-containing protein
MILHNRRPVRAGFTLIEVMVVILIISILVSLTVSVITKVRDKARQATAIADMAQIGSAIGAFKTKVNASYIPAFSPTQSSAGGFRLASTYVDTSGNPLAWPEVTYLKQLFPQMSLTDNGLRLNGQVVGNGIVQPSGAASLQTLDPNQTLVFFLTGSLFTNFTGFSTNRTTPFATPSGQSVGPFIDVSGGKVDTTTGHFLDPWGNPYAYMAFDPSLNTYPSTACSFTSNTSMGSVLPYTSGGKFVNLKGFQIISAGRDGAFGPGGTNWTPGTGVYAPGYTPGGADDLANFNSTPLSSQD